MTKKSTNAATNNVLSSMGKDSFGDIKIVSVYDRAIDTEKTDVALWASTGDVENIVSKEGEELTFFYFKRFTYKEVMALRSEATTLGDDRAVNHFANQLLKIEEGKVSFTKEQLMQKQGLKDNDELVQWFVDVYGFHTIVDLGSRIFPESALGKKNRSSLLSLAGSTPKN